MNKETSTNPKMKTRTTDREIGLIINNKKGKKEKKKTDLSKYQRRKLDRHNNRKRNKDIKQKQDVWNKEHLDNLEWSFSDILFYDYRCDYDYDYDYRNRSEVYTISVCLSCNTVLQRPGFNYTTCCGDMCSFEKDLQV